MVWESIGSVQIYSTSKSATLGRRLVCEQGDAIAEAAIIREIAKARDENEFDRGSFLWAVLSNSPRASVGLLWRLQKLGVVPFQLVLHTLAPSLVSELSLGLRKSMDAVGAHAGGKQGLSSRELPGVLDCLLGSWLEGEPVWPRARASAQLLLHSLWQLEPDAEQRHIWILARALNFSIPGCDTRACSRKIVKVMLADVLTSRWRRPANSSETLEKSTGKNPGTKVTPTGFERVFEVYGHIVSISDLAEVLASVVRKHTLNWDTIASFLVQFVCARAGPVPSEVWYLDHASNLRNLDTGLKVDEALMLVCNELLAESLSRQDGTLLGDTLGLALILSNVRAPAGLKWGEVWAEAFRDYSSWLSQQLLANPLVSPPSDGTRPVVRFILQILTTRVRSEPIHILRQNVKLVAKICDVKITGERYSNLAQSEILAREPDNRKPGRPTLEALLVEFAETGKVPGPIMQDFYFKSKKDWENEVLVPLLRVPETAGLNVELIRNDFLAVLMEKKMLTPPQLEHARVVAAMPTTPTAAAVTSPPDASDTPVTTTTTTTTTTTITTTTAMATITATTSALQSSVAQSEWRLPDIPSQVLPPSSELAKAFPSFTEFLGRLPAKLQTLEKNSNHGDVIMSDNDPFEEIDYAKSLGNHLRAISNEIDFSKHPKLMIELGDVLWNIFVISAACAIHAARNDDNNDHDNDDKNDALEQQQQLSLIDLRWLRLFVGVIYDFAPCHAILQLKSCAVLFSSKCLDFSSCLALFWSLILEQASASDADAVWTYSSLESPVVKELFEAMAVGDGVGDTLRLWDGHAFASTGDCWVTGMLEALIYHPRESLQLPLVRCYVDTVSRVTDGDESARNSFFPPLFLQRLSFRLLQYRYEIWLCSPSSSSPSNAVHGSPRFEFPYERFGFPAGDFPAIHSGTPFELADSAFYYVEKKYPWESRREAGSLEEFLRHIWLDLTLSLPPSIHRHLCYKAFVRSMLWNEFITSAGVVAVTAAVGRVWLSTVESGFVRVYDFFSSLMQDCNALQVSKPLADPQPVGFTPTQPSRTPTARHKIDTPGNARMNDSLTCSSSSSSPGRSAPFSSAAIAPAASGGSGFPSCSYASSSYSSSSHYSSASCSSCFSSSCPSSSCPSCPSSSCSSSSYSSSSCSSSSCSSFLPHPHDDFTAPHPDSPHLDQQSPGRDDPSEVIWLDRTPKRRLEAELSPLSVASSLSPRSPREENGKRLRPSSLSSAPAPALPPAASSSSSYLAGSSAAPLPSFPSENASNSVRPLPRANNAPHPQFETQRQPQQQPQHPYQPQYTTQYQPQSTPQSTPQYQQQNQQSTHLQLPQRQGFRHSSHTQAPTSTHFHSSSRTSGARPPNNRNFS